MNIIANMLKMLYQTTFDKHEQKVINDVLTISDLKKINNAKVTDIKKVVFIVPNLQPYAGGHTSILRIGTKLSDYFDVAYVGAFNQDIMQMKKISKMNLADVKGNFCSFSEYKKNNDADIVIATSWQTVYYAKALDGYKMYFVQDYEPYFFKMSERYILAKKTYEMGFHIVSLGRWNLEQIKKECTTNSILDYIDFPYEKKEYKFNNRNFDSYKNKKSINLAVYTKEEGKRLPNLIQSLLNDSKEKLKKVGINLEVNFFGLSNKYPVMVGKNLGKLDKNELQDLYSNSDFGMVASLTNISLVPYEMLASGLPIFEFCDGSFSSFFPENSATLIEMDSNDFVDKILFLLANVNEIDNQVTQAQKYLDKLSWDNSAIQFVEILRGVVHG